MGRLPAVPAPRGRSQTESILEIGTSRSTLLFQAPASCSPAPPGRGGAGSASPQQLSFLPAPPPPCLCAQGSLLCCTRPLSFDLQPSSWPLASSSMVAPAGASSLDVGGPPRGMLPGRRGHAVPPEQDSRLPGPLLCLLQKDLWTPDSMHTWHLRLCSGKP